MNINKQDKLGNSALDYACMYSRHEVAKYLLSLGADAKKMNKNNEIPMDYC